MALLLSILIAVPALLAQSSKPNTDVLIFTNGDKVVGHLVRARAGAVTFNSEMLGEINVEWTKIKELHSSTKFAVIQKDVQVHKTDGSAIPQGTIVVSEQNINVSTAPPRSIPVGDAAYVVDEDTFQKVVLHNPGFFKAWKGSMTAGASLVEATQQSRTFNGAIALIRAVPTENWLDARNRTTVNFSSSYGTVVQPDTPKLKTSIYHADAERDEYLSPRTFAFGQAAFDHNFSQGLELQQSYGGGIGWTVVKTANQTLDLKGSASYVAQRFESSTEDKNLFGSTFSEGYQRQFTRGIVFNQLLSITPAWSVLRAYSAVGTAGLALPVYKRFSLSVNTVDTFLNDPPPGFKKNSYQFTMGLAYALP